MKKGRKPKSETTKNKKIDKKSYNLKKTNQQLLRVSEVATFFNVTERTVYLWIDNGHLETETTPGGQLRVTKESIDKCRFLQGNN